MSFEYNEVDLDDLQFIKLVEGNISPKTNGVGGSSDDLTKEQKRKKQLVQLLDGDFEEFHSLLDELIACYHSFGRRNEFLSETLGVPDYIKCENCSNKGQSKNGKPICLETGEEKDGDTLYKIIPDTDSVPSFCSRKMRYVSFPEDRLDEVNDELLSIAEEGYSDYTDEKEETYKERREKALEEDREYSDYVTEDISDLIISKDEYTARELDKLIRGIFDPCDFEDFRRSALRIAWLFHLDDVLQEDYYPQRAEAYLRVMDSPHRSDTLPGQGGDEFEQDVREYLESLGFPMFDRVFELEGVDAKRKEMDVHTKFPWGERVIIEVFTSGAHSGKDKQLRQYAELLKQAEGIDAAQLMVTDGYLSHQTVGLELLINLLNSNPDMCSDIGLPGSEPSTSEMDDVEYLGNADGLCYEEFGPDFEPVKESKEVESQLIAKLRGLGYEPSLPVYRCRKQYGFCGPTVELGKGGDEISLTFFSNREHSWVQDGEENKRNERMFEKKDKGYGYKWAMEGPYSWRRNLASIKDIPVAVVEVSETTQSTLHPFVFDRLLRESP